MPQRTIYLTEEDVEVWEKFKKSQVTKQGMGKRIIRLIKMIKIHAGEENEII